MRATPNHNFLTIVLLTGTLGLLDAAMAGPRVPVAEAVQAAFAAPDLTRLAAIQIPEQEARFVRLVIRSADGAVGIDELEVFGPASDENLALASRGAIAHASSVIAGHPLHAIAHLNDGLYGNDHSWIAATPGEEWAEIELPKATRVARVGFTRDRTGAFTDRQARDVEVRLSLDGSTWQTAERQSQTARPAARPAARAAARLTLPASALPEPTWQGVVNYAFFRERDTWSRLNARDYLSPLLHDRPTEPGGTPYWGRLARLAPVARVLTQLDEMAVRLSAQGLDTTAERAESAALHSRLAAAPGLGEMDALYLAARHAKRRLFFRDPRLAPVAQVLFAKRHPLEPSHNYSEHMDSLFVPGGGICVLHVPRDADGRLDPARAEVETLFDGSAGIVRDPVATPDARTFYFAYRPNQPETAGWKPYWHLMAMDADGGNPRQLTTGPFHDFDPVPLPDGGLGFMSTRCKSRFVCWEPQAYVLYRMQPDGSNLRRLSFANVSEWNPTMMRDGRILWTRSEYQDKGADFGHTLWSIRPDGTHPELVFGNDTPYGYGHGREVPDSNEIVCTLISHGDHQGPIALIDRSRSPYDTEAITNITPDTCPQYQMGRSHKETFRDPEPISRDHFLVSHSPGPRSHWGIYIIDRFGNRELLYLDPAISSKRPSLLRQRPCPPVLPETSDPELARQGLGQFTVQDVYQGLGPGIARGQVKYLQVSKEVAPLLEQLTCGEFRSTHPAFQDFYATPVYQVAGPPRSYTTRTRNALQPHSFRAGTAAPGNDGLLTITEQAGWPSYAAKTVLGTVPIAADGAANFTAPAGAVLYFHLLDKDFNELQRMRSVVQLQPGERRGCIGCHDDRRQAPLPALSLTPAPVVPLEPPPWGAAPFDYQRVVQPVLDAKCLGCHHDGTLAGRTDLRGKLDAQRVPASYRALISGGWVHYFDWGYGSRHFKAEPLSFGTLQSRMFEVLARKSHQEVTLAPAELRALKGWIDLNCPLWPDYRFRPDRPATVAGQ
jgi:hypothetical protein